MRIGKRIGLSDERGVLAAVFVALIVVAATVAIYYAWFGPKPEPYNTISLLDADQKAIDYPQVLVAYQNSTFQVYVQVGNHMNQNHNYQVQVKIAKNLPASIPNGVLVDPVKTVDLFVADGQIQQNQVSVTENEVGVYSVVFELWQQDNAGTYSFTGDFCVLNVEVVS
jgi:uncharacterized membrane protein